jgi:hypothetical protein
MKKVAKFSRWSSHILSQEQVHIQQLRQYQHDEQREYQVVILN